jgi:hypothetical protein
MYISVDYWIEGSFNFLFQGYHTPIWCDLAMTLKINYYYITLNNKLLMLKV